MGILRRFAYDPFEPLKELLQKIEGCASHIEPMLEANFAEEYDVVKEHFRQIAHSEHEADEIKNGIRDGLRRSMFMPLDRWHFLDIVSAADKIADRAEDLGYLLTIRNTHIPPELRDLLKGLASKSLECYQQLMATVANIEELLESGFHGPVAEEIGKGLDQVCHLEWESDKLGYKFAQALFALEHQLSPIDLIMIRDIARSLTQFADSAEALAKQIRRTITR